MRLYRESESVDGGKRTKGKGNERDDLQDGNGVSCQQHSKGDVRDVNMPARRNQRRRRSRIQPAKGNEEKKRSTLTGQAGQARRREMNLARTGIELANPQAVNAITADNNPHNVDAKGQCRSAR